MIDLRMRNRSWDAVLLGLCWGVSAPLLILQEASLILFAMAFTVPFCLAVFLFAEWFIAKSVEHRMVSGEERVRRVAHVMMPCWLMGLSPIVLFLPYLGLFLILAILSVSLSLARYVALLGEVRFAGRPHSVERWIFVCLFLLGFVLLFNTNIVHDAFQYYGYMASVILDQDLNLFNEIYIKNTYQYYNPFPVHSARYMGTAVLEAPFFLLGHLVAAIYNKMGSFVAMNGYSTPYLFCVSAASALFGFMGVVLSYLFAREFFSRWVSMLAVILVWFATPLPFFMYCWGGWSHSFAFFFMAAFLLAWQRTRVERTLSQWVVLGVLHGVLCLIRPADGVVVLLPLVEWFLLIVRVRGSSLCRHVKGPVCAALASFVMFSPQLSLWKALSGSWISAPYKEVGDYYNWLRPHLVEMLFSIDQHGLFTWTPVVLLACLAFVLLWRKDRVLAVGSIAIVAGVIYMYACWSIWWTGIGFSNRFFISFSPFFVLGLAALLHLVERRWSREWLLGVAVCFVAANLFLVMGYRSNVIPQGIPDPYRMLDGGVIREKLVLSLLQPVSSRDVPEIYFHWLRDSLLFSKLLDAVAFRGIALACVVMLSLTTAAGIGYAIARYFVSKQHRGLGLRFALAAMLISVGLHGVVWCAAANTQPIGRFFHFNEVELVAQYPAEDVHVLCDYGAPVTSLDLLTKLIYSHDIGQGQPVASVTVFGEDGGEFTRILRAGIDTAETSYPRPEHQALLKHNIDRADVVRSYPTHAYSRTTYDLLTYRTSLELPKPMVVESVRIRYLQPIGKLIVSDMFLRNF